MDSSPLQAVQDLCTISAADYDLEGVIGGFQRSDQGESPYLNRIAYHGREPVMSEKGGAN
jgi:hypothetical protein